MQLLTPQGKHLWKKVVHWLLTLDKKLVRTYQILALNLVAHCQRRYKFFSNNSNNNSNNSNSSCYNNNRTNKINNNYYNNK
ncbi:ORF204 [White spot syndrome virus]|uniref:ORF204 n=1 Tax=White spot syndrome virus TaxID=342409 RepID=A0A2D3I620_9VIRU|nr:ORF204 [White spot syndrome virus]